MADCCIYTRISADKGKDTHTEGMGVARQEKQCRALAKRLGLTVTHVYRENDVSAYSGAHRPQFEAMLDAVKRGQYDAIICWHQDRLYRGMRDIERVIEICDATTTTVHTVSGGDLDLSNATGKMLARIVGSVSRQESEHKAERIRAARMQRAEAGAWFTNQRMFGYNLDATINRGEAKLIRKAAKDILAGRSTSSIIRDWNTSGVRTARGNTWLPVTFKRLFTNPRYAGLCEYKGRIVGRGDWPAIIDPDDHAGIVAILKDKSRGPKGQSWERKFIGSHRYLCGVCGALLEHYVNKGQHCYRCTASRHLGRQQPALDAYVETVALTYMRDQKNLAKALAAHSGPQADPGELRARRAALQAQKDELASMFTDGVLDGPAVRRESAKITTKIAAVDAALADMARRSPLAELVADGLDKLDQRWAQASPDIKGKIIDELMTVTVLPIGRGGRGPFNPDYVHIDWKTQ